MQSLFVTFLKLRAALLLPLSAVGLYYYWDPLYLIITLIAYLLFEVVGHDIGLHRYYTHRSFTCSKLAETFIWTCSFLSGLSETIGYVARHRRHHKFADTEFDNLQPTNHPFLTWFGFASLKATPVDMTQFDVAELANSKFHSFMSRHYYKIYYSIVIACFAIDAKLAFYVFILAVALTTHVAGGAGVICHKWGYRLFNTNDSSTNNTWLNLITFGLALHHNHHAFPRSYTHKVLDSEIDVSAWLIKNIFATSVVNYK